MKVTYTLYKNSILSTLCAFIAQIIIMPAGTLLGILGVIYIKSEPWGILCAAAIFGLGILLMRFADKHSQDIIFKQWIKSVENSGQIANLSESPMVGLALYKANPDKRTLNYIEKHNPTAAEMIRGGVRL